MEADMTPRAAFNRALAHLATGDFAAGWPLYEARIDHPDWVPWAVRASIERHQDRMLRPGDVLAGRHIVVFTEQGLGDNIMFARYLPMLAASGAQVTLACPPALRPIFARVAGIQTLLSPPADHPTGKLNLSALRFDAFVPLASLPYVFGTTPRSIPHALPYLSVDAKRVAAWRKRYKAAGRRGHRLVGVVFQANPDGRAAEFRSIPFGDVAPLANVAGVDLVNLQHGSAGRDLAARIPGIIDATKKSMALDEFAAAIVATDLLISVDTMATNLAGALNHRLWVALPSASSWQWGLGVETSSWYPSAAIPRAPADGGWRRLISTLCQRLREFSA